jgi:hypothetical protein
VISRLFHDVFARFGGGHRRLHAIRWRADGHDVNRRIGQHVIELVIRLAADLGGIFVCGGWNRVKAGDDFRPLNLRHRLGVKAGDHPAADDAETDRHGVSSSRTGF